MNKVVSEVSWQTFWRILVFIFLLILLYFARNTLGVLFAGIVISLGLSPFVDFLENRRIPRLLGTLAVFILGLFLIALAMYFIVPIIVVEARGFIEHFNETVTSFFGIGLSKTVIQSFSFSMEKIFNLLITADFSITGAASVVFENIVLLLATIIISFYFIVERDGVERLLQAILPDSYEKVILGIFRNFKVKIRKWLTAQIALGLIVGAFVSVGLWILDVKYALVLGLIAAIFELVPVIGPILAGTIAFLAAVSDSLSLGLYVVILFFVVQQLENHVLVPMVMGKVMNVHPMVVIIALLAGTQLAGFVGLILAVPFAVLAQEIFGYLAGLKSQRSLSA